MFSRLVWEPYESPAPRISTCSRFCLADSCIWLRLGASISDAMIRLVIPFPPGGAFDALGRPWAERIKPLLGTVVVENIGGGGASLGAAAVARARPDGYTILLGGTCQRGTAQNSAAL